MLIVSVADQCYKTISVSIAFITKADRIRMYVDTFLTAKEYSGLKKQYDNYLMPVVPYTPSVHKKSKDPIIKTPNYSKQFSLKFMYLTNSHIYC